MTALTILALAARMSDAACRANDPDQRYENETDSVMFGKLTELESIAESVWTSDAALSPEEERAMRAAQEAMTTAWNRLADIVFPFPGTES